MTTDFNSLTSATTRALTDQIALARGVTTRKMALSLLLSGLADLIDTELGNTTWRTGGGGGGGGGALTVTKTAPNFFVAPIGQETGVDLDQTATNYLDLDATTVFINRGTAFEVEDGTNSKQRLKCLKSGNYSILVGMAIGVPSTGSTRSNIISSIDVKRSGVAVEATEFEQAVYARNTVIVGSFTTSLTVDLEADDLIEMLLYRAVDFTANMDIGGDNSFISITENVGTPTVTGGGGAPVTHTSQYLALKATDNPTAADFEGANGVAFAAGSHTAIAPSTPAGNVYLLLWRISTDPEPVFLDVNNAGLNQFGAVMKQVGTIDLTNGDTGEVWVSENALAYQAASVEFR